MPDLVFDTTALVALEDHRRLRAFARGVVDRQDQLFVPVVVMTEFLAGFQERELSRGHFVLRPFRPIAIDPRLAYRAAELLRHARRSAPKARPSIVDALAAATAETYGNALVTRGDRADFLALRSAGGRFVLLDLDEVS